jgi:hypothetical protein
MTKTNPMPLARYSILLLLLLLLSKPLQSAAQIEDNPSVVELLNLAPQLLGYEQPMHYLIMLQLSDELRASGGFLKFLVYLHLENGQVMEIRALETGRAEIPGLGAWDWVDGNQHILPPQPIQDYLGLGNWVIRDANWWLDFRDTARQVQDFWEAAGFPPVDAVIAINDTAILEIVDSLGGIELANGTLLSGAELEDYLLLQFYNNLNDPSITSNQQELAQELSRALLTALLDIPVSRYPLLVTAGLGEANNNNISVSFNDPDFALIFHDFGYDGSLRAEGVSDYFYFVESNVSYSKLSQMIAYEMVYNAAIENNLRLSSNLEVRIQNNYRPENRRSGFPAYYYEGARWNYETQDFYRNEGYYGSYSRLALPETTQNMFFSGFDADAGYSQRLTNLNVVGGYLALERDEQQTLSFSWEQEQIYSSDNQLIFYVQRQPGLPDVALNFNLTYPECWTLLDSSAIPDETGNGFFRWHRVLDADQYFILQFESLAACE